jgi:hypothetical protein
MQPLSPMQSSQVNSSVFVMSKRTEGVYITYCTRLQKKGTKAHEITKTVF